MNNFVNKYFNSVLTQLYSEHSGGRGSYPSVHYKLGKHRLWAWGTWSWWCRRTLLSGDTSQSLRGGWDKDCVSVLARWLASVPSVLICTYHWEKHPREPWHSDASTRTPSSSWLENTHPDRYKTSSTTFFCKTSFSPYSPKCTLSTEQYLPIPEQLPWRRKSLRRK